MQTVPLYCHFLFGCPGKLLTPQIRVRNFINAKVHKGQGRAQNRHTQTSRYKEPPEASDQRPIALRPEKDRAPTGLARITQAQELQRNFSANRVDKCAYK